MFAARITLPHFSVSASINLPKSAGDPGSTVAPKSASRAFILGSARAPLTDLFSFSTISEGVFLGVPTPYHVLASYVDAAQVHAIAPGSATVTAEFNGMKAKLPITGYARGAYRKLPLGAKTPEVDGDVSDWTALPYEIGTTARFGVSFDDRFVYVGVNVKDSRLVILPGKPSADQDGVDVWLDARPDPMRAESKAHACLRLPDHLRLCAALSVAVRHRASRPPLPNDSKTACRLTPDGYSAEIAIPVEYLNRMQGADWRQFRLNVHVTDFTSASEPKSDLWWQPAWRSMQASAGSGTFERP